MTPRMLLEATLGGGRLLKRKSSVLMVAACGAAGLYGAISAFAAPLSKTAVDAENAGYAQTMLEQGRKTFRYDTFGSEAFWGDTLQLHKAIAGEKNGGVGPGVSPKTALSVGLKVDADALPDALKAQIAAGKVDLDDPATTIALLKLNAVVGVTAFTNPDGSVKSMGIQCAFCHSTVDNSFAPGIGKRLDGWANRDLNVGAIVSLAPNLKPYTDLLGVDVSNRAEGPRQLGAGPLRRGAEQGRQGLSSRREAGGNAHPTGVRTGRCEPRHLDRFWLSHLLERLCRRDPDAWSGRRSSMPRFNNKDQYPVSAKSGSGNTRDTPDRVTAKLAALHFYQLSIPAPKAPAGSYDKAAFERGKAIFDGPASAPPATCRRSSPSPATTCIRLSEMGIDAFQADRSPTHMYRTAPLAGLWTHQKGGFFHDGRFATLLDVVNHYDAHLKLKLSETNKKDLVEYLKGI